MDARPTAPAANGDPLATEGCYHRLMGRTVLLALLLSLGGCRGVAGYSTATGDARGDAALDGRPQADAREIADRGDAAGDQQHPSDLATDAPRPSDGPDDASLKDARKQDGLVVAIDGAVVCKPITLTSDPAFHDVAGSSLNNVMTVGSKGIYRLSTANATSYFVTSLPLYGIWVKGANDFLAAGTSGAIVAGDGAQLANYPGGNVDYRDVFGRGSGAGYTYYLVDINGKLTAYSLVTGSSTVADFSQVLWGISGTNTEWYVVGYDKLGSTTRGHLYWTQGAAWQPVVSPLSHLLAVSSPGTLTGTIAVGEGGLTIRRNAVAWTEKVLAGTGALRAAWALSSTEAVVAGDAGAVWHLKNNTWTPVTKLNGCAIKSDMVVEGIWGSGKTLVLVGHQGLPATQASAWWLTLP